MNQSQNGLETNLRSITAGRVDRGSMRAGASGCGFIEIGKKKSKEKENSSADMTNMWLRTFVQRVMFILQRPLSQDLGDTPSRAFSFSYWDPMRVRIWN